MKVLMIILNCPWRPGDDEARDPWTVVFWAVQFDFTVRVYRNGDFVKISFELEVAEREKGLCRIKRMADFAKAIGVDMSQATISVDGQTLEMAMLAQ